MTPDRWLEVRVRGGAVSSDVLVEALLEVGGRAVWEEDGWQVTHLGDGEDLEEREVIEALRRGLPVADSLEVRTRWQDHVDWAELWKQGLGVRRITPRLSVVPSWVGHEPEEGEKMLVIDPGMAFGTAEHGTTRGCLRLLDGTVTDGDRILDVGSGSGILGIAAVLLGAGRVEGLEMDPWSVDAARENAARNGVSDRVAFEEVMVTPELLAGRGQWDGVVANMETGRLHPLLPALCEAVVPGGWMVLSGILAGEFDEVNDTVQRSGAAFVRMDEDGEWRSGLFHRPPRSRG